jgi:hypothetical protein
MAGGVYRTRAERIQANEIWSFCKAKQRNAGTADANLVDGQTRGDGGPSLHRLLLRPGPASVPEDNSS